MLSELFLLAVILAGVVAMVSPRLGPYLLIVIACLQDPVRKVTPDTPAIMAISGLPVWLGMCLGAFQRDPATWRRFQQAYPRLERLARLFLACLVPPILIVFSYGLEAWRMALLGGFAYLAPLVTAVVAFSFVREPADLRRFLAFYSVFIALMLLGTPLEHAGWASALVGTEALGSVWIRYPEQGGDPFRLMSGFFRSPDILGWHAATLVMAALTLGFGSRSLRDRVWWLAVPWGLFCLLLAGRRKMMIMPAVWLAFMLLAYLRSRRLQRLASVALGASLAVAALWFVAGEGAIQGDYYAYAARTIADAPARFTQGTLRALWTTFFQSGLLGRGIGSATQGAQHVVGGPGQSWQESGASKLLVELGLPGFICALAVGLALFRAGRAVLSRISLGTMPGGMLAGLLGMLLANAVSFAISHQVYGDLLTVTLSAFLLGLALSGPRWASVPAQRPVVARTPLRTTPAGRAS